MCVRRIEGRKGKNTGSQVLIGTRAVPAEAIRVLIIWKIVKEKTMARHVLSSMGVIKGGPPLLPLHGPQHVMHSVT